MIRLLPLLLALAVALAGPADAQRGGGRGGGQGGSGGRSKLFSGARLGPARPDAGIDVREVMRKLKELQVAARARAEGGSLTVREFADESQLRSWFLTCDHNGNGWVSYSEAAHSLRFTRARFRIFDEDRDGRLRSGEFEDYYMSSITTNGHFTTPRPKHGEGVPPPRTAKQLRAAYDIDLDGELGELELSQVLLDHQQVAADPDSLLEALDTDGSATLDLEELEGLSEMLRPAEDGERGDGAVAPTTLAELFGQLVPRPSETGVPGPPRVVGPVAQFLRLDIDRDGYVSSSDLDTLMRPLRVGVRPRAVLNTLDADGDLRLSEDELRAALGGGQRR